MRDYTLVMTASVDPNGMADISAESCNGREDQYIRTLKFYAAQECVPRILFVENSNWDLTRMRREVDSPKIEWLSLNANSYPREWGKGYGEMYIMDRAIDWIGNNGIGGIVVKVTGRFPVLNIKTMVRDFLNREPMLLSVDVVEHNLYKVIGKKWCSHGCRTIVYACACDFYMRNLYGRYVEIPSPFWGAEHLMRDVWEKNKDLPGVYPRHKHEPSLSGYAGAVNHAWITANNYDSMLAKSKRMVKSVCRWVLPWLWI